jgi:fucose permease
MAVLPACQLLSLVGVANNMTDPLVKVFTGIFDGLTNFQSLPRNNPKPPSLG